MTDIDLNAITRAEALKVCQTVFGMDDTEASDFLDLARGETTTKAIKPKRVPKGNPKGGQFARKIGGYGGSFTAGLIRGGGGLAGHYAGRAAGARGGSALSILAQVGASVTARAAGDSLSARSIKLLRGKRQQATGAKLEKLGSAIGRTAYFAHLLRKPLGAAFRGARKGLRNRKRYNDSIRRAAASGLNPGKIIDVNNYRFAQRMLDRVAEKATKRSYNELMASANDAFRAQFPNSPSMNGVPSDYRWIAETWPTYVVVEESGKYYKVAYDADLTFADRSAWEEVERKVEWQTKEIPSTLTVFKEDNGDYRWVLLSSNGYRDRDGQIISTKALERDAALWELEGSAPDPLRWWHVALDEEHQKGLELGITDFRMVHEHTLIESGTFLTKEIGEGVYNAQDQLAASVGFRHSKSEPDEDGVFENVHIFERSLLPKGNAANVLTQLVVTE